MIYVFNRDLSGRRMLPAVESLQWHEKYCGAGTFSVTAGDTDQNAAILQKGKILHYQGYDGIIQQISIADGQITANGSSLAALLNQRALYNAVTITEVESGLYSAWTANRRNSDVLAASASGLSETVEAATYEGGQIGNMVEEICAQCGLGYRVRLDIPNNRKTFEIYKGRDLTNPADPASVVFSTAKNTLSGLEIDDDGSEYANVAVVRGADRDEKKVLVVVGTAAGAERVELDVDATSLTMQDEQPIYDDDGEQTGTQPAETLPEYKERLKAEGLKQLQEHIARTSFNATVSSRDYGKKYRLGDIVTCYSKKHGIQLAARVSEVSYTIDRKKESLEVVLGDAKITAKELVRLWQK